MHLASGIYPKRSNIGYRFANALSLTGESLLDNVPEGCQGHDANRSSEEILGTESALPFVADYLPEDGQHDGRTAI
jgi:hypothetical protein